MDVLNDVMSIVLKNGKTLLIAKSPYGSDNNVAGEFVNHKLSRGSDEIKRNLVNMEDYYYAHRIIELSDDAKKFTIRYKRGNELLMEGLNINEIAAVHSGDYELEKLFKHQSRF